MKIECNHCGAGYSVADEKVAGRRLKLRCKKCSEPIRVDGTALTAGGGQHGQDGHDGHDGHDSHDSHAAHDAHGQDVAMHTVPPSAPQPSPEAFQPPVAAHDAFDGPSVTVAPPEEEDAVWHITIGDTTQGPYTLDELVEYYATGSILLDTLVFRDGWTDWVPAGEVDVISQGAYAPMPPPAAGAASLAAGGVTMGSDPFADGAGIASPVVSAQQIMSGERRPEATVQFSLDEIRALSSASSPSIAPAPGLGSVGGLGGSSGQERPGFASGDASGLIDVAALAALSPMSRDDRYGYGDDDPDSMFGTQASPLDSLAPMALPPLGPDSHGAFDMRTKLIAGVAGLGLMLAGGVVVFALTYERAPTAQVAAAAALAPMPAAALAPEEAPTPAAALPSEDAPTAEADDGSALGDGADGADGADADDADDADDDNAAAAGPSGRSASKAKRRSSGAAKGARPARAARASKASNSTAPRKTAKRASGDIDDILDKPAKSSGGGASIDDLLDGALSGKSRPKAEPKPEPKNDLPATPSREAMLKAFGAAKAKTKQCKGDGIATAKMTIGGNGRVQNVDVTGVSGPAKGCVEKAVKSTSFPKFSKPSFQVAFPFKL